MAKKAKKSNFFLKLAIIAFSVYAVVNIVKLQVEISSRSAELEVLKVQVEDQRIENKEIQRLLELGDNEAYLERIAIEKLGFAYPDERVYKDVSGR